MPDRTIYPSLAELDRRLALATDPVDIERLERTKVLAQRLNHDHQSARRRRRMERTPEEIAFTRARLHPDGVKRCVNCGRSLPFSSFAAARSQRDGLQRGCRDCAAANPRHPDNKENR